MLFVFSHIHFYKTKFFYQQLPPFINFLTIFNFRTEMKKLELFFRTNLELAFEETGQGNLQ